MIIVCHETKTIVDQKIIAKGLNLEHSPSYTRHTRPLPTPQSKGRVARKADQ